MSYRFAAYSFLVAFVLLLLTNEIRSQYCIGRTGYQIRDEKGAVMPIDEIKNLTMTVNGYQLEMNQDDYFWAFHVNENSGREKRQRGDYVSNPMNFGIDLPAECGRLDEIVIKKNDIEMRLIFKVSRHNTYYVVDSLPFQHGTFKLTSLKCNGGKSPPMIDNNTTGVCFVAADFWKRVETSTLN